MIIGALNIENADQVLEVVINILFLLLRIRVNRKQDIGLDDFLHELTTEYIDVYLRNEEVAKEFHSRIVPFVSLHLPKKSFKEMELEDIYKLKRQFDKEIGRQ